MYVVDFLRSRRIRFETFLHQPASSAARLAGSAHIPGRNVAKTVVVRTSEGFALAVLPATSRVNLERFAAALRVDRAGVRLATVDEISQIFLDCEPGAIPPFGRLYGLRTAVDESLLEAEIVVFRTNARHLGLRMAFRDYEGMEDPIRALFGEPISPRTVRPGPIVLRHAGSLRNAEQR
jgi:Ala-tRNA(Pro) deacylase